MGPKRRKGTVVTRAPTKLSTRSTLHTPGSTPVTTPATTPAATPLHEPSDAAVTAFFTTAMADLSLPGLYTSTTAGSQTKTTSSTSKATVVSETIFEGRPEDNTTEEDSSVELFEEEGDKPADKPAKPAAKSSTGLPEPTARSTPKKQTPKKQTPKKQTPKKQTPKKQTPKKTAESQPVLALDRVAIHEDTFEEEEDSADDTPAAAEAKSKGKKGKGKAPKKNIRNNLGITSDQEDDLINWYKEHPVLYMKGTRGYKGNEKLLLDSEKAKELGPKYTSQDIFNWRKTVRTHFSRLVRPEASGAARKETLTERDQYILNNCRFLKDSIVHKPGKELSAISQLSANRPASDSDDDSYNPEDSLPASYDMSDLPPEQPAQDRPDSQQSQVFPGAPKPGAAAKGTKRKAPGDEAMHSAMHVIAGSMQAMSSAKKILKGSGCKMCPDHQELTPDQEYWRMKCQDLYHVGLHASPEIRRKMVRTIAEAALYWDDEASRQSRQHQEHTFQPPHPPQRLQMPPPPHPPPSSTYVPSHHQHHPQASSSSHHYQQHQPREGGSSRQTPSYTPMQPSHSTMTLMMDAQDSPEKYGYPPGPSFGQPAAHHQHQPSPSPSWTSGLLSPRK